MALLVGRHSELAGITRSLDAAERGEGGAVLVTGPAGIGKTRLCDAAVEAATARGLPVGRGYAVADPGAPALWPWLRLARDWPDVLAALTDGWHDGEPAAAARFARSVALADRLLERAGDGLLLVLEDLHWADDQSVHVLRHLLPELAGSHLVVLASARDTEGEGSESPWHRGLPDLLRSPGVLHLRLSGLTLPEVMSWLPYLSPRATDEPTARLLQESCDGNPLLLRMIAEDLPDSREQLERTVAARPELRRVLTARVDRLPADVRAVVDAAAVLGERVRPDLVAEVTGLASTRVAELLGHATVAGVLESRGAEGTAFVHGLVRDAVSAELSAAQRGDLHRRAAKALALRKESTVAGLVASHWDRADGGDASENCLQWAEIADKHAREALAYDEALGYARLAVSHAPEADDAERARLLVRQAEAEFAAGLIEASMTTSGAAGDLAERTGRADLLAAAALVVHGIGQPGGNRVIRLRCERALGLLDEADTVLRVRLLAQVATAAAEEEGGPAAAELAAEALAVAEQSGDPDAIVEAAAARHLSISVPMCVGEREALSQRVLALSASARSPVSALWGHLWSLDAAFQRGDMARVDAEFTAIDDLARVQRSPLARWHHHRAMAARQALLGEFDDARNEIEAAQALALRMGETSVMGMYHAFKGQLARLRGDPEELPVGAVAAIRSAPNIPLVRISLPMTHALQGDLERARAEFQQFRKLPARMPVGTRWAGTLEQIGHVAVMLDDAEVAGDVHDALLPTAGGYTGDGSGMVISYGATSGVLGDFARVAGRTAEALVHYRLALEMNERIGARPAAALCRLGIAQCLGPAHAESRSLARAARDEFRRLDMPGPRAAAEEFLTQPTGGLTAREQEIAALVAVALTNREIASRLVVSERTVETHVRNILTKLGLSTRTHIAAWMLRQ